MTEYAEDCSYCDDHGWWSAEQLPCPTCAACDALAAELRWCDAERRLALRALAEYAPMCDPCGSRAVVSVDVGHAREFRCERCRPDWRRYDGPLPYAAQIAAADEEIGR